MQKTIFDYTDKKVFILFFVIFFSVLVFSSDGHRGTFDEDTAAQQAKRIVTQEPHPDYVQGESKVNFEHERFKNPTGAPVCLNGVLCTTAKLMHSITEVPFVFINYHLSIITTENLIWTQEDFPSAAPHYVWWRNSLDPDLTFMELMYGPFFTALTGSVFFLIGRTFNFSKQISIFLTLLFVFATPLWAYSQSSLNLIPMMFFSLLSYYFFRNFQLCKKPRYLFFSSLSLGLGYMSRPDTGLIIIVLFIYLSYVILKENNKIRNSLSFILPLFSSYMFIKLINFVRFGIQNQIERSPQKQDIFSLIPYLGSHPLYEGGFGLFFSPGVGLFIFSPILLSIFFSFVDFFKSNKQTCIVIIVIVSLFVIYYGTLDTWHGLVGWGPRYLIPIIPFMLIPLGASLEKRKSKSLLILLISLGIIGAFVNLVYLVQDVSWFIWGWPGQSGLYGIDVIVDEFRNSLNLDPVVMWTFEYSQLTHSTVAFFSGYSNDIFLLKIFGIYYFPILFGLLSVPVFLLIKEIKKLQETGVYSKPNS